MNVARAATCVVALGATVPFLAGCEKTAQEDTIVNITDRVTLQNKSIGDRNGAFQQGDKCELLPDGEIVVFGDGRQPDTFRVVYYLPKHIEPQQRVGDLCHDNTIFLQTGKIWLILEML